MTSETLPAWEDLCKVCEHLSCLSMTSDHYQNQNGKKYRPFANKGWPHMAAIEALIHKTTKGIHAYRGTQLGTQTPAPEPVVSTPVPELVVSTLVPELVVLTLVPELVVSTPVPEPVILTPSSSKHGFSSLNDTVASSSTSLNKRARNTLSTMTAIHGLQSTLETFTTTLNSAYTHPIPVNVSPINISLPPLSQHDPRSSAAQHLQRSFDESSASEGGAWLSRQEFYEGLSLIRADSAFSTIYVSLSEDASRGFLRMQLEQARTARASAPGGSDP